MYCLNISMNKAFYKVYMQTLQVRLAPQNITSTSCIKLISIGVLCLNILKKHKKYEMSNKYNVFAING